MDDLVELGRTAGAYGFRGWVRIVPLESGEVLQKARTWVLTDLKGVRTTLNIEAFRRHGDGFIAKWAGCETKEAADAARANAQRRFAKRHSSPQLTAVANGARRDGGSHASRAAEGPERTGKNILKVVLLAIGVLLVVALLVRLITGLLIGDRESDRQQVARSDAEPTQAEQIASEQQQVEVSVGESVTFQGQSFSISQDGGTYSVTRDGAVVFNLEGTPTGLVLYNGSLVVPENRAGGWDVVSYMIADGSVPAYVMGADGNAAGGSGDIQSATLDGSALKVTDSTGATTSVALG